MTSIDEAIKRSETFYRKFRKAYKTIPPFYRGLGKEAAIEYFRRVASKRSTAHWHLDYKGVRYWFWRIWEDPGITKFDSRERVTAMLPCWEKHGVARSNLWFYSFNKPEEAQMNENLKRHRPDIKAMGGGKALACMPEDPMGA